MRFGGKKGLVRDARFAQVKECGRVQVVGA